MIKIFIVGAGRGGSEILSHLIRFDWVEISGVADHNPKAPGLFIAQEANIPVFTSDPLEALSGQKLDLVFDLTGDPGVQTRLFNLANRTFNVVSGESTNLFVRMIRQLGEQEKLMRETLEGHQILSEISLILSRSETSDEIFEAIIKGGMQMTGMPAASLSIYNRDKGELFLVSAKGFSTEFYQNTTYMVRRGGLTEHILSQKAPILISDIENFPAFNNPVLLKERIRSLIAIPLISENGPIGILYLDDFKPRTFVPSMMEVLKLLAIKATVAIQKQQTLEKFLALSIRDPITGLYNRRYLNEVLVTEMDRALRLHHPLSVVLFDIDHFKEINDRFGHIEGDRILQNLTRHFGLMIRRYDIFARFGGDEFVILMADTDAAGAQILADRLWKAVPSGKYLPDNAPITCSFGINTLPATEIRRITPDEFLRGADRALYEAKQNGRNQIVNCHSGGGYPGLKRDENFSRSSITRSVSRRP